MDQTDDALAEHQLNYINHLLTKSGWQSLAEYFRYVDESDAKIAELQRIQEGRAN